MKKQAPANTMRAPETADSQFPVLLALLAGLILIAFFVYPAGSYPYQALMLSAIALVTAIVLTAWLVRAWLSPSSRQLDSILFHSAIGSVPVLGGLGFVLWAVGRWHFAEVPELERDWIAGLLSFGVALVLGCGAGAVCASFEINKKSPGASGESAMRVFFRLMAVAAIGFGVYAFYQYFIAYPRSYAMIDAETHGRVRDLDIQSMLHALRERRVGGTLGNPNLFAAQLSLLALLSLAALRDSRRAWRWAGAAGAAAAFAAFILSRSRGGALTMALALAMGGILLWLGRPQGNHSALRIPNSALWLFAGAALLLAAEAHAAHEGLLQRLGNISTVRERIFYWQIALKVWARHPLIGEGPGGYQLLYLTLKSPIARESQHAHSWFFQIGSELGLIGLGLFTCFFTVAAGRVWAAWRRRSAGTPSPLRSDAGWCAAGLLLLVFNGLFEFSLQWHAFLTSLGLLGGLVCGLTGSGVLPSGENQLATGSRFRNPQFLIALLMSFAVAILTLVIAPPLYMVNDLKWKAELAERDDPPRISEAASLYGRAVRMLPRSPGLRLAWAAALERTGLAGEAWNQLTEAQRLNPRSAAVRASQADWFLYQNQREKALEKLGEALELYPSHVGYRLERARQELAAGQTAAAKADLGYIETNRLPVWEFQQPDYLKLRSQAGLPPVTDIPS